MIGKTSHHRRLRGFTLIEMSIVVVIIGMIMITIYPALNSLMRSQRAMMTQSNIQTLMRSVASYVLIHHCLPCPTALGESSPLGISPPCGACQTQEGIVPFISLGLPARMARDGMNRWITMRIDDGLTSSTSLSEFCTAPMKNTIQVTSAGSTGHYAILFMSAESCSQTVQTGNYTSCADNSFGSYNEDTSSATMMYMGRDSLVSFLGTQSCEAP